MPLDVEGIRKLAKYYKTDLYGNTLTAQEEDDTYINDTFQTPIKPPHREFRSGIGKRMVDAPAEQIVTSNPQAEIVMLSVSQTAQDIIKRLSFELNQHWLQLLRRQNPQPFKENVKDKCGRGVSYIQIMHNENYVDDGTYYGLPVLYLVRDPMIVFASLEEDDNGIPKNFIIQCDRLYADIKHLYPDWSNPSRRARWGNNKFVKWLEYWDGKVYYREADGESVSGGIKKHGYGITPLVRGYSGLGRESQDGDPASLIVSTIRFNRDLILEECMLRSDLASRAHIYAHEPTTIIAEGEINQTQVRQLKWGVDDVNVLSKTGGKVDLIRGNMTAPPVELYNRLMQIQSELLQRCPFLGAGSPQGTSGRQDDLAYVAAKRAYDTIVENTSNEWATALEIGLKYICKIPGQKPKRLKESDLDADFQVRVKLKASDPIEEDRLITLGDRLRRLPNPAIDLGTFHTDYLGISQDESKKIQAKMLADMVTIYNPDWAEIAGMVAAEESGMEMWLDRIRQRRQEMGEQGQGLGKPPPATTQERALGEVETPTGREMGTEGTKGGRHSPARWTRGM